MPDPSSILAGRYNSSSQPLKERQFQFTQEQGAISDQLKQLAEARQQALAEKTLTIEATNLQRQTQADLDAAGFLKHFQYLNHNDPNYENKREALAATFPMAGHDDTVKATVNDRNVARQTYLETTKSGGAYDFPEGPARDTFHRTFTATGDFNAAKADAKQVAEGEKAIRDAKAQGYLTAEDFATPDGQALPPVFNKDGSVNYRKAQDLAAERAGKTTGAVLKQSDRELATAQTYVQAYLKDSAKMVDEDPNAKELYQLYSAKLLENARKQAGTGTTSTAAPSATPAAPTAASTPAAAPASPAKPAVVKQNGVTYTLQPDGSYK